MPPWASTNAAWTGSAKLRGGLSRNGVDCAHGPEIAEAEELVRLWNSRAARGGWPPFYPTIRTAILAGTPWLTFECPACKQCGELDLRTLDRTSAHDHRRPHPTIVVQAMQPQSAVRPAAGAPIMNATISRSTASREQPRHDCDRGRRYLKRKIRMSRLPCATGRAARGSSSRASRQC